MPRDVGAVAGQVPGSGPPTADRPFVPGDLPGPDILAPPDMVRYRVKSVFLGSPRPCPVFGLRTAASLARRGRSAKQYPRRMIGEEPDCVVSCRAGTPRRPAVAPWLARAGGS